MAELASASESADAAACQDDAFLHFGQTAMETA